MVSICDPSSICFYLWSLHYLFLFVIPPVCVSICDPSSICFYLWSLQYLFLFVILPVFVSICDPSSISWYSGSFQIKRMIKKKHILPSYKMRYKPLFIKPEEFYVNPDLSFRGNRLGKGQLVVKVLRCSRLPELSKDSKLYCTLSVGRCFYHIFYHVFNVK